MPSCMTEDISFDKMKGSLGSLLLLWSEIEQSTRKELAQITDRPPPSPSHGMAAVLRDWETATTARHQKSPFAILIISAVVAELRAALKIRNALCHGLTGISASRYEKPAELRWHVNGEEGRITWSEMEAWFAQLSRLSRAIWFLSRSSSGSKTRLEDTPENRDWWRAEHGIDLNNPIPPHK